jgi:hypothetical protein
MIIMPHSRPGHRCSSKAMRTSGTHRAHVRLGRVATTRGSKCGQVLPRRAKDAHFRAVAIGGPGTARYLRRDDRDIALTQRPYVTFHAQSRGIACAGRYPSPVVLLVDVGLAIAGGSELFQGEARLASGVEDHLLALDYLISGLP